MKKPLQTCSKIEHNSKAFPATAWHFLGEHAAIFAPSVEAGILVTLWRDSTRRVLIECYNSGEAAAVFMNGTRAQRAIDLEVSNSQLAIAAQPA